MAEDPDQVKKWEEQIEAWERDSSQPCPYDIARTGAVHYTSSLPIHLI